MECPDCGHVDDESSFQEDREDDFVCPECEYFWAE